VTARTPAADEAPRCADWARGTGLNPQGTAFSAETVTLVGVPLPWPKPVFEHPALIGLEASMDTTWGRTRVLAFAAATMAPDTAQVLIYKDETVAAFQVPITELAAFVADPAQRVAETDAPRQMLAVCTQGTHDVCCGTDGTRFAIEAENVTEVIRVSHTGGHRFAPTALQLPEGRMWAYLDMDVITAIMEKSQPPANLVSHYRGSIFVPPGAEQVAESAVFAVSGWGWKPTSVSPSGSGSFAVTGQVAGQIAQYEVILEPWREVPTIACRQPGGQPIKTRVEYRVKSIMESVPDSIPE
jgi:hypothetical protein